MEALFLAGILLGVPVLSGYGLYALLRERGRAGEDGAPTALVKGLSDDETAVLGVVGALQAADFLAGDEDGL